MRRIPVLAAALIFVAILSGCAEKGGWNLSTKELQARRSKNAAELAESDFVSLVTFQNKLDLALAYVYNSLTPGGVPPDPGDAMEALGYADEYVAECARISKKLDDLVRERSKEIEALMDDPAELKPRERGNLVALAAMLAPKFQSLYDQYLDAVRAYLDAARKRGELLSERYNDILLALPGSMDGFSALDERFVATFQEMGRAFDQYSDFRDSAMKAAQMRLSGKKE